MARTGVSVNHINLYNVTSTNNIVCDIDNIHVFWYLQKMTPEGIYREVGRNIRRYRASTHRTQAQLASEIGISRASLANIEAGRQQVLLHHLYAIADALDLDSPSVLMPMPPSPDGNPAEVPLPTEGLSETQRQEVLRLMGGILKNENTSETEAD